MKRVMIPSLEFRQADAGQALNFLIDATTSKPPTNVPCLGIIQTNAPITPVTNYVLRLEDGTPLSLPTLTLIYHRISLLDAISSLTKQLGLTFRFENDQLVLFTKDGKRIIRNESVEQGPPAYAKPEAAE